MLVINLTGVLLDVTIRLLFDPLDLIDCIVELGLFSLVKYLGSHNLFNSSFLDVELLVSHLLVLLHYSAIWAGFGLQIFDLSNHALNTIL